MKSSVLVLFLTLILLEGLLYVFFKNYSDPLFHAWQILEPDSNLGWKQKANLDRQFYDLVIQTDEHGFRKGRANYSNNQFAILVLGPSSSFGWGVSQGKTYADRLGENFEVFNASQIGFSSEQGLLLWKKYFADKTTKNVIWAYGINDLDYFRFFDNQYLLPDKVYFKQERALSFFVQAGLKLNLGLLFYRAFLEKDAFFECGITELPQRRVSSADILENLKSMREFLVSAKLIIVSTPFALPEKYHANLESLFTKQDKVLLPDSGVRLQDSSNWLYASAKKFAIAGNCESAKRSYHLAKSFEPFRIQSEVQQLNADLSKLELADSIYIDIQGELQSYLEKGEKVFVDPVHPSERGHQIIFEKIQKALDAGHG